MPIDLSLCFVEFLFFFLPFSQCRERGTTYKAKLQVTVQWKLDNQVQGNVTKVIGNIPIMVKVGLNSYKL